MPVKIMSDFEMSIINACRSALLDVSISCYFFHFSQSVSKDTGTGVSSRILHS